MSLEIPELLDNSVQRVAQLPNVRQAIALLGLDEETRTEVIEK